MTTSPTASRRLLSRWYVAHGRHDLEWRLSRDPYAVLVSEVMLQQTQVERVRPYYREWVVRWPDAHSLANADPADVIRAWAGLGYNRRAVDLQRAAAQAHASYGGIPSTSTELLTLPGVGPYTANAVACFAAGARVPVLDTNVARVIARGSLGVPTPRDATPKALSAAADDLLPATGAREHNLALMDLGATVCTARQPDCGECPLITQCAWRAAGSPPVSRPLRPPGPRFETTARYARGRIVAALRDATRPLHEDDVAAHLPEHHQPDTPRHLEALERDGLAVRVPGGWSLPVRAG